MKKGKAVALVKGRVTLAWLNTSAGYARKCERKQRKHDKNEEALEINTNLITFTLEAR